MTLDMKNFVYYTPTEVVFGKGSESKVGSLAAVSRFVRFAVNVMGVHDDFTDPEATALAGIEAMERFYRDLSMPTSISELIGREATDSEIRLMAEKCSRGGTRTVGHFKELDMADMEAIYRLAR